MPQSLIDLILDEGKWLPAAMALSAAAVLALFYRQRRATSALRAMQLFYGCMIGIMAGGHLLAVTLKFALGTLSGTPWSLYAIGCGLAVPAWWLALRAGPYYREDRIRATTALNAWLGLLLLALGLHNAPLALPAALSIAHRFHTRPAVGRAIAALFTFAMLGLFVGALAFMASGQNFEQFSFGQ